MGETFYLVSPLPFERYCVGVNPNSSLKYLLKYLMELNPTLSEISEILYELPRSNWAARFNRTERIKSFGVNPVMDSNLRYS